MITVFSSPPSPMLVCAVRKKASARRRVGFTPWVGHALPGKTPYPDLSCSIYRSARLRRISLGWSVRGRKTPTHSFRACDRRHIPKLRRLWLFSSSARQWLPKAIPTRCVKNWKRSRVRPQKQKPKMNRGGKQNWLQGRKRSCRLSHLSHPTLHWALARAMTTAAMPQPTSFQLLANRRRYGIGDGAQCWQILVGSQSA